MSGILSVRSESRSDPPVIPSDFCCRNLPFDLSHEQPCELNDQGGPFPRESRRYPPEYRVILADFRVAAVASFLGEPPCTLRGLRPFG
jgi:hypothetical protein